MKVSICIPTYNGELYIAKAMDSAITQTYPNLEIVVSDDASSDRTLAIIKTYKTKTKIPIHVYKHKPKGIGANWNNCLKNADGEYIKFLFQDDLLLPTCIEEMMFILTNNSKISLVACKRDFLVHESYLTYDTKNWIDKYSDLQKNLKLKYTAGVAYMDQSLFEHVEFFKSPLNKIGEPSAVLFKKSIVQTIGYFREDLQQVLDFEFYYRILKINKIAILDKQLIKFRLHENQATIKNINLFEEEHKKLGYIFYRNYFSYLSKYDRKCLARTYNPIIRFLYNSIDKLKNIV